MGVRPVFGVVCVNEEAIQFCVTSEKLCAGVVKVMAPWVALVKVALKVADTGLYIPVAG